MCSIVLVMYKADIIISLNVAYYCHGLAENLSIWCLKKTIDD